MIFCINHGDQRGFSIDFRRQKLTSKVDPRAGGVESLIPVMNKSVYYICQAEQNSKILSVYFQIKESMTASAQTTIFC